MTDDELLAAKPARAVSPAGKEEEEGRRVVRRIGALGNASLEKHVIDNDKEKYLRGRLTASLAGKRCNKIVSKTVMVWDTLWFGMFSYVLTVDQ